jgi:hypothetical protein
MPLASVEQDVEAARVVLDSPTHAKFGPYRYDLVKLDQNEGNIFPANPPKNVRAQFGSRCSAGGVEWPDSLGTAVPRF